MKLYTLALVGVLGMFGISAQAKDLLIFGGSGHDEFLGCLTCSEYDSDSVCNGYGTYGNEYSSSGMWNEYSGFGNEYSSDSPWNEYSSSKSIPVLVDSEGNFYGYFTINEYRSDAVEFASEMNDWFDEFDGDLDKVRIRVCDAFGKSGQGLIFIFDESQQTRNNQQTVWQVVQLGKMMIIEFLFFNICFCNDF